MPDFKQTVDLSSNDKTEMEVNVNFISKRKSVFRMSEIFNPHLTSWNYKLCLDFIVRHEQFLNIVALQNASGVQNIRKVISGKKRLSPFECERLHKVLLQLQESPVSYIIPRVKATLKEEWEQEELKKMTNWSYDDHMKEDMLDFYLKNYPKNKLPQLLQKIQNIINSPE